MNIATISSALLFCAILGSPCHAEEQPLSVAEQRLFLDPHLQNTARIEALRYSYARSGSAPGAFSDSVKVALGADVAPGSRKTNVQFLSGERSLSLPDTESASANPAILSFLERDVREMQRLTRGQANYFRKRVRMALADNAQVEDINVPWQDRSIAAWRISLTPYVKDPLRARFEQFANKRYEFVLSQQVPGWVYEMRTTVTDAQGKPLIEEVMHYQGSEP